MAGQNIKGILESKLISELSCQGMLLNVHMILHSSVKQAMQTPGVNAWFFTLSVSTLMKMSDYIWCYSYSSRMLLQQGCREDNNEVERDVQRADRIDVSLQERCGQSQGLGEEHTEVMRRLTISMNVPGDLGWLNYLQTFHNSL